MQTWLKRAALLSLATCTPLLAAPPLPAEHLTETTLTIGNPHWIFVLDEAFANEIDARVHLFDGDTYRRLGQIGGNDIPGRCWNMLRHRLEMGHTELDIQAVEGNHGEFQLAALDLNLAGLRAGVWPDLDSLRRLPQEGREFLPRLPENERRRRLETWHRAVQAVIAFYTAGALPGNGG